MDKNYHIKTFWYEPNWYLALNNCWLNGNQIGYEKFEKTILGTYLAEGRETYAGPGEGLHICFVYHLCADFEFAPAGKNQS